MSDWWRFLHKPFGLFVQKSPRTNLVTRQSG